MNYYSIRLDGGTPFEYFRIKSLLNGRSAHDDTQSDIFQVARTCDIDTVAKDAQAVAGISITVSVGPVTSEYFY